MKNYSYAQIDENDICIGISNLSGKVVNDSLIEIESMNTDLLGMRYNKETLTWEEVEIQTLPLEEIQEKDEPKVDLVEV